MLTLPLCSITRLCTGHDHCCFEVWVVCVRVIISFALYYKLFVFRSWSPSLGSAIRLYTGCDHRRFAVWSVIDDPIVGVGLLNDSAVIIFWSPPHHTLHQQCWRLLHHRLVVQTDGDDRFITTSVVWGGSDDQMINNGLMHTYRRRNGIASCFHNIIIKSMLYRYNNQNPHIMSIHRIHTSSPQTSLLFTITMHAKILSVWVDVVTEAAVRLHNKALLSIDLHNENELAVLRVCATSACKTKWI